MKILGISLGGQNGNNDCMCKEALMGAKEMGAEVEFIHLMDLNIQHCTGCNACSAKAFSGKGNKCVINDDFEWLVDKMYDADGIIFAVPIFCEGAPGVFHNIIDRFGPRMDKATCMIGEKTASGSIDPRYINNKICVSYMSFGGSEWVTRVQGDCFIQSMTPLWKIIDNKIYDHSLNIMGDDARIAEIHQVGVNMYNACKDPDNASYQSEPGVCPHCHGREFYFAENGDVVCNQCGIVGRMEITENGPSFIYDEEKQIPIAHDVLSGKFAHMEYIGRAVGAQMEFKKTDTYKTRLQKYKDFISPIRPEK
ncbi:NAD(P)H-dependent oxidoreductase [Baileyella intestinalis]|uniref:NAD(P)H-dependent oxidoreductase n=1 Tax=Baileyella intestinalis TaxID=2606709 RepID=UPI0022E688CA|nr:NAD(P)H-dependent oxidoreductase [Baileyella intestinalis]